jgi:hypothetical protein
MPLPAELQTYLDALSRLDALVHQRTPESVALAYAVHRGLPPEEASAKLAGSDSTLLAQAQAWVHQQTPDETVTSLDGLEKVYPKSIRWAARYARTDVLHGTSRWTPNLSAMLMPASHVLLTLPHAMLAGEVEETTLEDVPVTLVHEEAASAQGVYYAGLYAHGEDRIYLPTFLHRLRCHRLDAPAERAEALHADLYLSALHEMGERAVARDEFPAYMPREHRALLRATAETQELLPDLYMLEQLAGKDHDTRQRLGLRLAREGREKGGLDGTLLAYALHSPQPVAAHRDALRTFLESCREPATTQEPLEASDWAAGSVFGLPGEEWAHLPKFSAERLHAQAAEYARRVSESSPGPRYLA